MNHQNKIAISNTNQGLAKHIKYDYQAQKNNVLNRSSGWQSMVGYGWIR